MHIRRALDSLDFCLADVQGAFGPYVAIFLLTRQHWNAESIGIVTTISAIVGIALRTPAGAYIDATRFKRGSIVVCVTLVAISAIVVALIPVVSVVVIAVMALAGRDWTPVRLIALSDYGQAEDKQRTQQAGFAGHLVKPVDFSLLRQALAGTGGQALDAPHTKS